MRAVTYFLILLLSLSSAALADSEKPVSVRVIGLPRSGAKILCVMGWSAAAIKKLEKEEARQNTIEYWCQANSGPMRTEYQKLFKNEPVSYIITFEGKSDIGTLHPTSLVSEKANNAALEILQRGPILTTPPSDLPFRRGLLIRFSSSGRTVQLAPEGRVRALKRIEK